MTKVKNGDTVHVHYTGKLDNGVVFDTSTSREPLEVKIGEGSVIPGFESGLLEMSKGETKILDIEKDSFHNPILHLHHLILILKFVSVGKADHLHCL